MVFGIPWWILIVIGLIFFSGYMAFRAMIAERKLEQEYIEQEGKVFLERIEEDRKRRNKLSGQ